VVAGARGLKPQLGTVRFRGRVRSRYSAVSSLFALSFLCLYHSVNAGRTWPGTGRRAVDPLSCGALPEFLFVCSRARLQTGECRVCQMFSIPRIGSAISGISRGDVVGVIFNRVIFTFK
jgi:hypothetical protein